jgi:hypothetical protein
MRCNGALHGYATMQYAGHIYRNRITYLAFEKSK